jgi:hypothetical protein
MTSKSGRCTAWISQGALRSGWGGTDDPGHLTGNYWVGVLGNVADIRNNRFWVVRVVAACPDGKQRGVLGVFCYWVFSGMKYSMGHRHASISRLSETSVTSPAGTKRPSQRVATILCLPASLSRCRTALEGLSQLYDASGDVHEAAYLMSSTENEGDTPLDPLERLLVSLRKFNRSGWGVRTLCILLEAKIHG